MVSIVHHTPSSKEYGPVNNLKGSTSICQGLGFEKGVRGKVALDACLCVLYTSTVRDGNTWGSRALLPPAALVHTRYDNYIHTWTPRTVRARSSRQTFEHTVPVTSMEYPYMSTPYSSTSITKTLRYIVVNHKMILGVRVYPIPMSYCHTTSESK